MLAVALQAVAAFNLVCSSVVTLDGHEARQSQIIIRVDLNTNRFCVGQCLEVFPITSVSPTEVIFEQWERDRESFIRRVDRTSGRYYSEHHVISRIAIASGVCERVPFTGFPQRQF